MEHLTNETLARLVDEAPDERQTAHLETCETCAAELAALRDQTEALAALPEIVPPLGDWQVLEARLRSEGLIEDPGLFRTLGLAHTPGWMRVAAAIVLFLGGTATGSALTASGAPDGELLGETATLDATDFASTLTVDDAAERVRAAQQEYANALAEYQERLREQSGDGGGVDPRSRFAALEILEWASQAAVRRAPEDPWLNGLYASVLGEREATARQVSRRDNWF